MSTNDPSSQSDSAPFVPPSQNESVTQATLANENSSLQKMEPELLVAANDSQVIAEVAPTSETQSAVKVSKPRIWSVVLTMVLASLVYVAISVIVVAIGIVILNISGKNVSMNSSEEMMESLITLFPSPVLFLIVPPHLGILGVVILAAVLSPSPFTQRLALTRPNWPWWVTIATVLVAPFFSFLWSIVINSMFDSNAYMEQMSEMFQTSSEGMGFAITLLCIAVMPAFSEEWLFRGYIQSRLTQRWRPWLAVLVSSILFAGFHMEPLHVIAVLPLGIWLGFISYRCASIIPAMLAHAYNNTLSLISVVYEQSDALDTSTSSLTNQLIIYLGIPSLLIFIAYLVVTSKQKPAIDVNTPTL